jgi:hypothetical protein
MPLMLSPGVNIMRDDFHVAATNSREHRCSEMPSPTRSDDLGTRKQIHEIPRVSFFRMKSVVPQRALVEVTILRVHVGGGWLRGVRDRVLWHKFAVV